MILRNYVNFRYEMVLSVTLGVVTGLQGVLKIHIEILADPKTFGICFKTMGQGSK